MKSKNPLGKDRRGILELPFKLMIMMMLITATASVGMISYRNIRRRAFERHVVQELERIAMVSRQLMNEGNLSSQVIELDLSGDTFTGLNYVRIGDRVGGRRAGMISYSMNWRRQRETMDVQDVQFTSSRNINFLLRGGTYQLRLTSLHISREDTVIIISLEGQRIDYSNFYR